MKRLLVLPSVLFLCTALTTGRAWPQDPVTVKVIVPEGVKVVVEYVPAVKPPPDKDQKYYFMIVRQNGPAQPTFTTALGDPNWNVLTGQGHKVKDFQVSDAVARGLKVPAGTILPAVWTLVENAAAGNSTVIAGPVPMPTGADILKLVPIATTTKPSSTKGK